MSASKTPASDWDGLAFALSKTDEIFRAAGDTTADPVWSKGEFLPFADVSISPAAAVLSYGLGVFEGLKAERTPDGRILLFRPQENARRLQRSAALFEMPPFPEDRFLSAVEEIVRRNLNHLPPAGKGTLYIRPIQFAAEPVLGLRRCSRFEILIYASPVGSYFKDGEKRKSLRLRALRQGRVAPGGSGAAKAIGNYPLGIRARMSWKDKGFDDVLYLDARHLRYVTETSGSNVFARLKDGTWVTPPLDDQILAGVTRDSVLRIARETLGWKVEERALDLEEVLGGASEVFCTGTAWTVRSVGEIVTEERATPFSEEAGRRELFEILRGVQSGKEDDAYGWTREVDRS